MARLLVLWLLNERSMHGYEIKKSLSDDGVRFWFGLEDASIYSVLRTLSKNGFAEAAEPERRGNRPARTRYAITAAGRQHYRWLLAKALSTPTLPLGPIDVALAARGDLDPSVVGENLAARAKALHELLEQIDRARPAAPNPAIVDRNRSIVEAEQAWLERLDHASIS